MGKSHKVCKVTQKNAYYMIQFIQNSIYIKFKNNLECKKSGLCLPLGEGIWLLDGQQAEKDFQDANNIMFLDLNMDCIGIIYK